MTRLTSEPVFAALTRPQMIGGVTYTYAILNLIVTGELFLITKSFWVLGVALVIHAIGYAGSIREPRFFDIWVTRLRSCPRVRNFGFWGGNSYAP
ncbi:type IV secretion system protein VirB3 [Phenylobacterium sp.]|uniref:type IV secretion system protein VirB3 n=1 Tax=Phenylobacterium sp. TaxID=1871053 RepID=UPI0025EEBA8A|nr:type IV secretion system protein VirB3 [Phenylobacterium sp.]MCA3721174.1 type IV secretion system protein VirB3 [Phenylobacterium sp.]